MHIERIEALLKEKKIQKKDFLSQLDLNINTFSAWRKRGTVPNGAILQKIADYFDVTVDYLLGQEDAPTTDASLSENEIKLLTLFRAVPEDKQEHLLRIVEDALNILR